MRKHGVKTLASAGLHSAHCHGCGAPYTGEEGGSCAYCGRPLNDGSGSWVLEGIMPFTGARVNSARISPVSGAMPVSADILLIAMARMMHSDGRLDPQEMEMLEHFAAQRGISEERLGSIIATASSEDSPVQPPSTGSESMELLRAMVRMSLADGELDQSEKALLERFAGSAGMSANVVSSTIARERKSLYRESKRMK